MKKVREVDTLYKRIDTAQNKLNAIRKACKHKSYSVQLYSWRIGSVAPQRICKKCDAVVPGITTQEAKPFVDSLQATWGSNTASSSTFTISKNDLQ